MESVTKYPLFSRTTFGGSVECSGLESATQSGLSSLPNPSEIPTNVSKTSAAKSKTMFPLKGKPESTLPTDDMLGKLIKNLKNVSQARISDLPPFTLIRISWVDSKNPTMGWCWIEDLEPAVAKCQSIGFLLHDDTEKVVICQTYAKEPGGVQVNGVTTIPARSVTSINSLIREGDDIYILSPIEEVATCPQSPHTASSSPSEQLSNLA